MRASRGFAATAAILCALVSGCSRTPTATAPEHPPARVDHSHGTSVGRVILSRRALQRVGLRTARVREMTHAGHRLETIPSAALVYEPDGSTWTYARVAPRAFVRRLVRVSRIEGRIAVLTRGPPPGTQVVTTGAAELYGTEYGVGEE